MHTEACRQLAVRGYRVLLTGPGGEPVAEGAARVVWAATLPDSGPTGGFFRDGQAVPW